MIHYPKRQIGDKVKIKIPELSVFDSIRYHDKKTYIVSKVINEFRYRLSSLSGCDEGTWHPSYFESEFESEFITEEEMQI